MDELLDLNKQVINRIKFLQKQSQLETAAKFKIGDIVSFTDDDNHKQKAIVMRISSKTIKVITLKKHDAWNISPTLLTLERKGEKADLLKLFDVAMNTEKKK